MKTLIQRVARAEVRVDGACIARIGRGALLLVGVERGDGPAEVATTARRVATLRFFPDRTPMDRTLHEVGGACLVVSQFTLAASLHKGNRPSFTHAEDPERAEQRYLEVAAALQATGLQVETGRFGADMQIELVNDGPVTFLLETRNRRA